jgi:DNA-directed RNA polymerase specialized sigma24 family protein
MTTENAQIDIAPLVIEPVIAPPKKSMYLTNKVLLPAIVEAKEKGVMTDKLATMLQLLCSKYATKGNFVNYCVDETTEALTQRGWVNGLDITTEDNILSYDIDSSDLVWSNVFEIYRNYEYDGMMHHLTTQGMDALVTPNHKFVSAERGIIPVEDIISNEHIILMGNPVANNVTDYSDYLVELVGWAVTEGHYSTKSKNKHSIHISQKLGVKSDRIRDVLQHLCIPHKEYLNKQGIVLFHCNGQVISNIHQVISPKRVISSNFILSLTQPQRMILINTMVAGDGWIRPNGGLSYTQKCKDHIDAFLMLCTLAGLTTQTTIRNRPAPSTTNGRISYDSNNTTYVTTNDVVVYNVPRIQCKAEGINFHGGKQSAGGRREDKPNLPTVQYKGLVWCPMTEYGTFVCRRGGKIYITGNTYNDDMQAYAMMMLVRTWKSFDLNKSNNPFAFFTQCIKNSFKQYLNLEKRQRTIRDLLLVDQGLNPSYGFQDENASDQHYVDDEQDFDFYKEAAVELQQQLTNEDPMFNDEEGSDSDDGEETEQTDEDREDALLM